MRLAEIDMEKEEALNEAREAYEIAYNRVMVLIDKYPLAHRKPEQQTEVSNASNVCTIMQMKLEIAKSERHTL